MRFPRERLTIRQVIVAVAVIAIGFAATRAFALGERVPGISAGIFALVIALTVGTDRAIFGHRCRAFWLGFVLSGCMYIAFVFILQEVTDLSIIRHVYNRLSPLLGQPSYPIPTIADTLKEALPSFTIYFVAGTLVACIGGLIGIVFWPIVTFVSREIRHRRSM
jgi:hypothetical protein